MMDSVSCGKQHVENPHVLFTEGEVASVAMRCGSLLCRKIMMAAIVTALGAACFAVPATNVWTGAAGDGKWSTPGNWEGGVVPVSGNGDTVIVNGTNGSDLENDIDDLVITRIFLIGSATVNLTGKPLTVGYPAEDFSYCWTNSCPVNCYIPINVKMTSKPNDRYLVFFKNVNFYAPITGVGSKNLHLHSRPNSGASVYFHAPVTAECLYLQQSANSFHFYASITTTTYTSSASYGDSGAGWAYFYVPMKNGNYFNSAFRKFGCKAANVLDPDAELRWEGYPTTGLVDMMGFDQTVNRLGGTYAYVTSKTTKYPADSARVLTSSTGPATLTMRATESDTTPAIVTGSVTLKYAPTSSDCVQTFSHRTNTTDGAILVMDGTVKIADGTIFRNVPMIYVGPTATLEIDADNGIENPFPALRALEVADGGKVKIPDGVALTAARVVYGTTRMPDGVACTSATGWIEGDGSLTPSVAAFASPTVWVTLSGDWNTAANWSAGVPTISLPSQIYGLAGTETTVTVSSDTAPSTNLTVRADEGSVKLCVNALLPFSDAWISFGKGTTVEVGDGGHIDYDGTLYGSSNTREFVTVADGASVTVKNGGKMSFTDIPGRILVGGNTGTEGSLNIEAGGEVDVLQGQTSAVVRVNSGGTLDLKGLLTLNRRFGNKSSQLFSLYGGDLTASGNGEFRVKKGPDGTTGSHIYMTGGNVRFKDDAKITYPNGSSWNSELFFGSTSDATYPMCAEFTDNACVSGFVGHVTVCGNSVLDMSSARYGFFRKGDASFYDLTVGSRNSDSKFYYGGAGFSISYYGFFIGHNTNTANEPGRGEVVLMNGARVDDSASAACTRSAVSSGSVPLKQFYGTLVGLWLNAPTAVSSTDRPQKGELRLKGAATKHTTGYGHFIVGAGCAEGRYVQEDGTNLVVTSTASGNNDGFIAYATNSVMVVGMLGGLGECIVSNGYFKSNVRTFIGGCYTNEYFDGAYFSYGTSKRTVSFRNAEGYLRVAGGKVECVKPVFVGSDGSGTIEIGRSGTFVADTVVLSNQTASTLKFKFGPDGVGTASVKKLVIAPGAKLEIDASAYEGLRSHFSILAADDIEGAFGGQDIEVCGDMAGRPVTVVTLPDGKGFKVVLVRGTRIMLR